MAASPPSPPVSLLDAALSLARKGGPILPLKSGAKLPAIQRGIKDASTAVARIRLWWGYNPDYNIGMRTDGLLVIDVDVADGKPGPESLAAAEATLGALPPTLEQRTASGGRHLIFRQTEPGPDQDFLSNSAGKLGPGLDTRGHDRGYIVVAPSRLADGGTYAWVEGHGPDEIEVAVLPDAWAERLRAPKGGGSNAAPLEPLPGEISEYARAAMERECGAVACMVKGGRNQRLNTAAYSLAQIVAAGGLPEDLVRQGLANAARACGLPPAEADRTIESGITAGLKEPRDLPAPRPPRRPREEPPPHDQPPSGPPPDEPPPPDGEGSDDPPPPPSHYELASLDRNDTGNGERFRYRFGADYFVVHEQHRDNKDGWLVWTQDDDGGGHWNGDKAWHQARIAGQRTAKLIKKEAEAIRDTEPVPKEADFAHIEDPDERKAKLKEAKLLRSDRIGAHRKFAISSGNEGKLVAMLKAAASHIVVSQDSLDADPFLIGVRNGVLDLPQEEGRYATLRPADRRDRITRICHAAYEPNAPRAKFELFLREVQPDIEVRGDLQRFLGYCLSADIGEQVMNCWWGGGANGKSTLLNIIRDVLGSYVVSLPFESFTREGQRSGGDATPDLVRLPGARLALASEPPVGVVLDEGTIKAQTGGEPMLARGMFRDFFEFLPTHKLILSFNNRPRVRAQDEGTWRRLLVVPWPVKIAKAKRDKRIAEKIVAAERNGILSWLVDGYVMWRERGLDPPQAVLENTERYRRESNPLADFVDRCVNREKGAGIVFATELYEAYIVWCRAAAEEPIKQNRFGRILADMGFEKRKSNRIAYLDVALDDEEMKILRESAPGQHRRDDDDDDV